MEQPIHLEEYNLAWPEKFQREKELIEATLGNWIQGGVHHVGSTAIPGLIAKPIIDIMVGVNDLKESRVCIPALENIGYVYSPYKPDQMHWFCKPSLEYRDFHLYLIATSHPEWQARLAFRDYLLKYPEVAQEYVALKRELARKFKNDREAYTEGKDRFVTSITEKALKELERYSKNF